MACADLNGNGELSYTNWIIATANRSQAIDDAKLRVAFDFFDQDKRGAITKENIEDQMRDMQDVDEATWNEIIAEVDEDGDGEINFEEFKKMMMVLVEPKTRARQMTVQPKAFLKMMQDNSDSSKKLSVIEESDDGCNPKSI